MRDLAAAAPCQLARGNRPTRLGLESLRVGSNGTERPQRELKTPPRKYLSISNFVMLGWVMFYPSALQYFSALQRLSFHWRLRRDVIGFCVVALFCSGGTPIP